METGGWLVQDVERLARVSLGEFGGKFYSLTLTTGEGGTALSQFDIAETYILQRLDLVENLRHVLEEFHRLVDGHIQYVGDALALISHLQGLTVVSFAMTNLARYVDIREEIHLDGLVTISLTFLTSSTLHVEGESARLVTTDLRLRQANEKTADIAEDTGVGGWIAARRSADRTLVYIHHLIYIVDTLDTVIRHRLLQTAIEMLGEDRLKSLVDEGGLARTAHSRNHDEFAEREVNVYSLQVVAPGAPDGDVLAIAVTTHGRNLDSHLAIEILGGDGIGLEHFGRCSLKDYFATLATRLRTDVYNPVGSTHHILVMFYDDNRIAQVAQFLETVEQALVVALVQTDARLIKDVEYVDELAANLCGKADALTFTARERSRLTVE